MSTITIAGKKISVVPHWDDFEPRRENSHLRSATLRYNITGTAEASEADIALLFCSDSIILGCLYRVSTSIERTAKKGFEGVVEYEYKNVDDFSFSFETTGGTQHLTQSYETLGRYAPDDETPPDHGGAIGVNDNDIAGCDVTVPILSFSMSRSKSGILDPAFIKFLAGITGRINVVPFLEFLPGEVLFEGASGSQKFSASDSDLPMFDLTYKFRVSPSVSDLSVGDIYVGYKRGWDYLWVQYIETEDEAANMISRSPAAAFIERVYQEADLNLLM